MAEPNLWVCHRCRKLGDGFEAGRHVDETGHEVEELSPELSAAVRAEQDRLATLAGAQRVGGFIAYARFM